MSKKRQPKHNLLNRKFGKLTVINFIGFRNKGGNKGAWWQCKCDCGNLVDVPARLLLKGNTTSCGCSRKKDLLGKRFGKLTVIAMAKKPAHIKSTSAYWLCKCDCGNTCLVSTGNLVNKGQKSCGCTLSNPTQQLVKSRQDALQQGRENTHIDNVYYPIIIKEQPNINNKSGYRGVSFDKSSKSWCFELRVKGVRYRERGFKTPESAHKAYLAQKEKIIKQWTETLSEEDLKKIKKIKKDNEV